MKEIHLIETLPQAGELFKPLRIRILKELTEPSTCTEIAEKLDLTPQKVNYHVKVMLKAGLVEKVSERQVRGTVEKTYQAAARSYYLSPELVTELGGKLPVNPSGGLKAKGHPVGATGAAQAYEIYLQLTARAEKRQVDGAEIGLTHNVGGSGATACVHIYRRD